MVTADERFVNGGPGPLPWPAPQRSCGLRERRGDREERLRPRVRPNGIAVHAAAGV
jgi:hypothetical protein